MKEYLIIGGSIAGMNCIEGIRSIDGSGRITLVTDEPVFNYGRPLISYYLEGKTDIERMQYKPSDFFVKNGVDVISGVRAESLDPQRRSVKLSDGRVLPYDALCICTGSSPFLPRFEGIENVEKRFSFMKLEDALALEKAVDKTSRVLIIGAGFIGLKCAEGLAGRAGSLTVCDLAPKVMSATLDDTASGIVSRRLTDSGIELMLADSVQRFEKSGAEDEYTAIMNSGRTVGFDILVIAIGVRPNISLLKDAGGNVNKGILTNHGMRTSVEGIWAAGDCVESTDVVSGAKGVLAILPNAAMQGYCAGRNMAGADEVFEKNMRMNSIGLFGTHIMTAGTSGECIYSEVAEDSCKKLFAEDGRLCGFIIVGDVAKAGIYTSLIRNKTPLDGLDLDKLLKDPSLIPFGKAYRKEKLGSPV